MLRLNTKFRNLTLKQLRAFYMVAQERSFTRAAGRLNISQSALTLGVQDLEREVGLSLLDRSTRSVRMTAQGEIFLPIVERILEELSCAVEDMQAVAERRHGSVSVAANASFISVVLAPALATIAREHPGIRVRITEDTADRLFRSVLDGEADFGVSTIWRPTGDLKARVLIKDRFGVVCHQSHPLAKVAGAIKWAAVSRYRTIALPEGAGIRSIVDHHPQIANVIPRPMYEVSSVAAMLSMVAHGVGVAVLPGLAIQLGVPKGLAFRPLRAPQIMRELHLVTCARRALSPAAEQFAAIMLKEVRSLRQSDNLALSLT